MKIGYPIIARTPIFGARLIREITSGGTIQIDGDDRSITRAVFLVLDRPDSLREKAPSLLESDR
jgi:hypothetical protein